MTRPRPAVVSVGSAVLLGALLAACSSTAKTTLNSSAGTATSIAGSALANPTTTTPPAARRLIVVEHDFGLATSTRTLSAGSVEFSITNQGPSSHELLAFHTDLPEDQLPLGPDGRIDEDAIPKVVDTETDLTPGTQRDLTEPLTPGRYVLVCNLPGHYKLGMHTVITVT